VTTVAHEARLSPGRPAPWGVAIGATFIAWVAAAVIVGAVSFLSAELGLVWRPSGSGPATWPYPDTGAWSLAANVVVWTWIVALTALVLRGALADRFERRVSAVPIAAALALTGFAPFLPRGVFDLPWPVGLLATAALVRLGAHALGPMPKRTTAALLAAGTLFLAVPAAYGLVHPLWFDGLAASEPPRRGTTGWFTFRMRNAGLAGATVEKVELRMPTPVVALAAVRIDRRPPLEPRSPFGEAPRPPFEVRARETAFVQLRLRAKGCGSVPSLPAEAVLRYRLHGSTFTGVVPLRLHPPRCS
jgi:hypothetical protein